MDLELAKVSFRALKPRDRIHCKYGSLDGVTYNVLRDVNIVMETFVFPAPFEVRINVDMVRHRTHFLKGDELWA